MLKPVLEEARDKLNEAIADRGFGDEPVAISIGTLTTQQAIGSPDRQDYALLEGREVMIEAAFRGSCGQAFTDRPQDFSGSLNDILGLNLDSNEKRAVFTATLNAVTAHLGLVSGLRHCRDNEPEECAGEIAAYIRNNSSPVKVGIVGYQPAILEKVAGALGPENVRCTDLNPKNIGSEKSGVTLRDGATGTTEMIDWSDIVLATSSTITNNTFDAIRAEAAARDKRLIIFGVTGAGTAALLGLERVCFRAH